MPAKPPRPPLPSLTLDDDGEADRIRDYARSKGLVQTTPPAPQPGIGEGGPADPTEPEPTDPGSIRVEPNPPRSPAAAAHPAAAPAAEEGPPPPRAGRQSPMAPPQPRAPRRAAASRPSAPTPALPRPAPTRPWQAMFPDYLIDQLKLAAAEAGTAQKVVVLEALRAAGFQIDDIDLQDLRRR